MHDRMSEDYYMNDEPEPILQFFSYAHLPNRLQGFSKPFHELAILLIREITPNTERTAALRKLLEAKDCAVRASIMGKAQPVSRETVRHETPNPKHMKAYTEDTDYDPKN